MCQAFEEAAQGKLSRDELGTHLLLYAPAPPDAVRAQIRCEGPTESSQPREPPV